MNTNNQHKVENTAIGLGLDASRQSGKFIHNIDAYIDFARTNSVQTQQRWGGGQHTSWTIASTTEHMHLV